jgi:Protein of unknown function (DUF4256)
MKRKPLPKAQANDTLLTLLRERFERHPDWHPDLPWDRVKKRLEQQPRALRSLAAMEASGGEPDVVGWDPRTGEIRFADCAPQSPSGRTKACYDREALDSRREFKPKHCATELAEEMGIVILDEDQYRELQTLGEFDTKSSSWIRTPEDLRRLGGALFGDRRYGRVFIYHNGAQSYYEGRGFRGMLVV